MVGVRAYKHIQKVFALGNGAKVGESPLQDIIGSRVLLVLRRGNFPLMKSIISLIYIPMKTEGVPIYSLNEAQFSECILVR